MAYAQAPLGAAPGVASGGPRGSPPLIVVLIKVKGTINPATAGYIARGIDEAIAAKAQCVILQLDTPGGLLDSTKDIVQSFYRSELPVVVYVGPSGANATSAGAFITLASDVAAMAPNTSIGAAHPVSIGGGGGAEKVDDVMKQKLENFTISYMETIAQKRGRNVEWAKSAVRDSANITAEVALSTKVIEIIAKDVPDLLLQLEGRTVKERALRTEGAEVREIPMSMREQVFQMAWRPEVLMILLLIAIYGILGEVSHPGTIIPGVVGAVALVLVLYMSAALPMNAAGLVLIALAIGLFIAEAFTPAFGLLVGGGAISLFFGLLMLFDRADPLFRLSLTFIIPATAVTAGFFLLVMGAGLRAQRLPIKAGREIMIGKTIPALTTITSQSGKVFVEGEYWNAVSETTIAMGERAEIVGLQGLTLKVKPATPVNQQE
ncbi:MAG: nodulation protein NfeD [Vicinamibacteria bacterium]|nr:nodulation protein NfeD [Vicinamibacteria bacterium]